MGCVLPAGVGQAPARQAAHRRRASRQRSARVTVNKVCGSGLKAVMFGAQRDRGRRADVVVAGGMESMSQRAVPACPRRARATAWATRRSIDSHDPRRPVGLRTANVHMGDCAELCAKEKGITRARQDAFAAEIYRRALARAGRRASSGRDRRRSRSPQQEGPAERRRRRRGAGARRHREAGRAAPGVPEGRHGHRRQRVVDQRRRGGAGADGAPTPPRRAAGSRSRASSAAAGTRRRPSGSPPRRRARSSALLDARRLEDGRRRPLGDQRGVRGRVDREQPAARARSRAGERLGRRGRARPPDRRVGRARAGDAAVRAARRGQASAASRRCASAAARASRSRSSREPDAP